MDFETYRKLFVFMKEYLIMAQEEKNEVEEMIVQESKVRKELELNEGKMGRVEQSEKEKEREFQDEISKLEAKRKKLEEKYDKM